MRWNVAISLRDPTKHSPSATAEIEACTCPVRKGRAPVSSPPLHARSLEPAARVSCSSCFVLALSVCPPSRSLAPRNSHALFPPPPSRFSVQIFRSFVVFSSVHFATPLLLRPPLLHLLLGKVLRRFPAPPLLRTSCFTLL